MKGIVKIVLGIGLISLFAGSVFAVMPSCETMVDSLVLPNKQLTVEGLTQNFCKQISTKSCMHDGDPFDASQSVFLTILCDNVGRGDDFVINRDMLLKTGFTQFGVFDYGFGEDEEGSTINFCDYTQTDLNGCDLSKYLPKIFDPIMNDYFNIKQADLYGVDDIEDSTTSEELVNKFSKKNFVGLELCDPDSDYYGEACKYTKNYMKSAKNLLKKTKVIDFEELKKQEIECGDSWTGNILYCALVGDDIRPENSFVGAIYNEYLWYRLFISYYTYELANDHRYSDLNTNDTRKKIDSNMDKVYSFQEQIFRSRQAVSLALRSLSEISSSFSLHIGFIMYQEDAQMFMKQIAKIYPPIMTLYDKLRNVQKAE
ncbi:MAG TPA: hypothetical protein VJ892_00215 [Candidatus Absconditabacterales bacterium]|nr:hypothetical protein [Candidatus Absconditabacterales bacterium]